MKASAALVLASVLVGGSLFPNAAPARPFEVPVGRLALRPEPGAPTPTSGVAAYFFAVPIDVGWSRLAALLDTGSIGVRVLQSQVRPRDIVSSDNHPEKETFGGTTVLTGVAAKARVGLGPFPLFPPVTLQLIRAGSCAPDPDKPGQTEPCPLDKESFGEFRFGGQGRPGKGFPAVFGIRAQQPPADSEVGNPLSQTGHPRTIVDLPRADRDPGRLIVDPNQLQTQGFVPLTSAPNGTVLGCLEDSDAGSGSAVCGNVLLDSGAPSITVTPSPNCTSRTASLRFPSGFAARIRFVDSSGATLATQSFVVGSQPYAGVSIAQGTQAPTQPCISLGQIPFMSFSVLIDAQTGTLAIRTRPNPPPKVPTGQIGG